jgi:hypothetical protein
MASLWIMPLGIGIRGLAHRAHSPFPCSVCEVPYPQSPRAGGVLPGDGNWLLLPQTIPTGSPEMDKL